MNKVLRTMIAATLAFVVVGMSLLAPTQRASADPDTDATHEYYRLQFQGVIDNLHFHDDQTKAIWDTCQLLR